MALTKNQIKVLYRKRAANYDFSANLYYLIGFREERYRKSAVSALRLKPGDTVVEIGCGTGLNFRYLQAEVGETGRIIGVDLTDAMLEKARDRVDRKGWKNVEVVKSDAATYMFPEKVHGVISTFALTLIPEYETVIERASRALSPGQRVVILDLKKPEKWPLWLVRPAVFITKPFGVSLDIADRKPWEKMKKYFSMVTVKGLYGGFAFIAAGENTSKSTNSTVNRENQDIAVGSC
jgi:demethylmenaquinone methyltransferase/2-methoxy-6-polyprenyl-1,4-benzoquinol methylase